MAKNLEFKLNSRKKSISQPSGLKPINFKPAKYNPNEIIEIEYLDRYVRGLPPLRMTRKKFSEYWEKEREKGLEELKEFLLYRQRMHKYDKKHPSKITFAFAYN